MATVRDRICVMCIDEFPPTLLAVVIFLRRESKVVEFSIDDLNGSEFVSLTVQVIPVIVLGSDETSLGNFFTIINKKNSKND